jgi:hypothetical protein
MGEPQVVRIRIFIRTTIFEMASSKNLIQNPPEALHPVKRMEGGDLI